ncbi:hypothetical protein D3C81_1950050 [compost metagenome]
MHTAVFDDGAADGFTGTEGALNSVAVAQVFKLGAHECGTFTRLDMLEIEDGKNIPIHLYGQACFEIVN